jgi:hypothetical protein
MTQNAWIPGSWAKVGDLVRVFNGLRQVLGMGIVAKRDRKQRVYVALPGGNSRWMADHHVQAYRPNFDYDSEVSNGRIRT